MNENYDAELAQAKAALSEATAQIEQFKQITKEKDEMIGHLQAALQQAEAPRTIGLGKLDGKQFANYWIATA